MAAQFNGTLKGLEAKIADAGLSGKWQSDILGNKHTFRCNNKGILNWWPKSGTIQFQGPESGKSEIENAFGMLDGVGNSSPSDNGASQTTSKTIFIVHGHDHDARDQLELILRRLELEPNILMNRSPDGKTIIEALEGQIGYNPQADFGIVLLTPDDFGHPKDDSDKMEPRARQNVILEMGMLLSSLTRERMAIIKKGHVEIPTDLQGVIYHCYNDHVKEVALRCAPIVEPV